MTKHHTKRPFYSVSPGGRFILAAFLAGICFLTLSAAPARADQEGGLLLSLLGKMESSYARLKDYTAVFRKHERVDNNKIRDEQILVKFQKPFKVYMKWIDEAKEALYVDGENNNQVLARCDGLLGLTTWRFNPTAAVLMRGNRHPITEIGFGYILQVMDKDFNMAKQYGEVEVVKMEDETFDGRPSTVIEAKFTPHDGRKYYAARMVCHVDKEFVLPVGITCYDDKNELMEQYSYLNLKPNVGLTAMDFSKENKEYRF